MLNLLRVGTGLAIVLAMVSVHLWRELRTERRLTAELQAQVTDAANPDPGSMPATQRVDDRAGAVAQVAMDGGGNPESPPPMPQQAPAVTGTRIISETSLMADPEFRKARLTQLRMNLKRNYTGVSEELGLSEAETEQLFDILAEQQMDGRNGSEDALRALLGPGRQAKWQEYQQTIPARNRATSMTAMLATSGHPLTEEQLRPLTTALIAEEKYVRQQQSTLPQPGPMTIESRLRQQEEVTNRQEESNRRYLEAAAPYMSAQQLSLVRETLEQQIAMSRASARMQLKRLEAATPPR